MQNAESGMKKAALAATCFFSIQHSAFCIRFMTDETPPILRSWRNLYTAALLALAVEVARFGHL